MYQNLTKYDRIVDENGCPTDYFMRILQTRGIGQTSVEERVTALEGIDILVTSPIAGGGSLADGLDITISHIDVAATKLWGRGSAAGAGAPQEITVGSGLDLTGTTLTCTVVGLTDGDKGDITVSASGATWTIDTNTITDTKLRDSTALSVIGRSANSTGDPADITAGSDGYVLRRSGTTLGFGTIATAGITDDAVTFAKFQNITANRVLGRTDASTGDMQELSLGPGLVISGTEFWAAGSDVNTQTGTTYTFVLTDKDGYVRFTNGSAITLTVPANSSVAFRTGTVLTVRQAGAGQITLSPAGGVTLNSYGASLTTAGQHATVQLKKVATDEWDVIGHVA